MLWEPMTHRALSVARPRSNWSPGQVLTPEMLTPDPLPGPGERVVGVQLDGTRAPGGLVPGDRVSVLAVPPGR